MTPEKFTNDIEGLYSIIRLLRSSQGCPWDRKQSRESIKKYLLEEADELAEALTRNDHGHVCEETGDLFFILLMIIRIYEEENHFSLNNVLSGIVQKMIRRHPHVFAGAKTGSESELKLQWESIKSREKKNS